jgi:hypothetical protein
LGEVKTELLEFFAQIGSNHKFYNLAHSFLEGKDKKSGFFRRQTLSPVIRQRLLSGRLCGSHASTAAISLLKKIRKASPEMPHFEMLPK